MNPEETPGAAPGVAEPATPPTEAVATPGETPVTTPEPDKQYVPLERFQEVNNSLKELKEWKESQEAANTPTVEEPEIDPETAKILDSYLTRNGFVRQQDLTAKEIAAQQQQDLKDIQTEFKLSDSDVQELAKAADAAGAKNAQGLRNAYFARNLDKIVEERVKEALAKSGDSSTYTEKPGNSGGGEPTKSSQSAGMSIKDRIAAARGGK